MSALGVTRMRLERLADEREKLGEKIEDLLKMAEDEKRDLEDIEQQHLTKHRERYAELEGEIIELAADIERTEGSRDVSRLLRHNEDDEGDGGDGKRYATPRSDSSVYRSFAEYARDSLIVRYPEIAQRASLNGDVVATREQAQERLQRTIADTTSGVIPGLVPPRHIAEIMDIINASRPVAQSGRQVALDRGSLTYPKISQRPAVTIQSTEKTEGGTANMQVTLETLTAETYIGGGDLSWQAINWSTPDALSLWFDLAAEAYARATEEAVCDVLEDTVGVGTLGTASNQLGSAGTESFGDWRKAVLGGISSIYSTTAGRARTNTLYLSADRFFQLAAVGSDESVQLSAVGNLDVGAMTGTFAGLRVVGSYGLDTYAAIVGDSSALIVAETPGAPVQLRAVEPTIGGMQLGVIGAFKAVVFDTDRFLNIGHHS